jgi:hypothetical protein
MGEAGVRDGAGPGLHRRPANVPLTDAHQRRVQFSKVFCFFSSERRIFFLERKKQRTFVIGT